MTVLNINLEIKERCETLVRLDQIDKNQYAKNKMSFEFLSSEIERNRKESFEIIQKIVSEIKKHENEIKDKTLELSDCQEMLKYCENEDVDNLVEIFNLDDFDNLESLGRHIKNSIEFLECDIEDLKKVKFVIK